MTNIVLPSGVKVRLGVAAPGRWILRMILPSASSTRMFGAQRHQPVNAWQGPRDEPRRFQPWVQESAGDLGCREAHGDLGLGVPGAVGPMNRIGLDRLRDLAPNRSGLGL